MNLLSILIVLIIGILFALALRHTIRHGACSECSKNAAEGGTSCCGNCAACHGCKK